MLKSIRTVVEPLRRNLDDRGLVLTRLRGMGKTVLLRELNGRCGAARRHLSDSSRTGSVPGCLLSGEDQTRRVRRAFAGLVRGVAVRLSDVGLTLNLEPVEGLAATGDLGFDLQQRLRAVGEAGVRRTDQPPYLPRRRTAPLVAAPNRIAQIELPLLLFVAGLPQLLTLLGRVKTHAERLFVYNLIDAPDPTVAAAVVREPPSKASVTIEHAVLHGIWRSPRVTVTCSRSRALDLGSQRT